MSSKSMEVTKHQRHSDSSTVEHCCVPECTASAELNSALSFHTFPEDDELQKKWIVNIRRDEFVPSSHARVCSQHFQKGDLTEPSSPAGRRRLKKGAVPLLFEWNDYSIPVPMPEVQQRREQLDTDTDQSVDVPKEVAHNDHDYCTPLGDTRDLHAELKKLRRQIEELTLRNRFCLERFAASDDSIQFYTRFATHAHLMAFWRMIEPATHMMIPMTRAEAAAAKKKRKIMAYTRNAASLQPIDEFFLFLTHLSLGILERDLAHRFNIQQSEVSHIIETWANFLYTVLGSVGIWMSQEAVKAHLPEEFKDYPDTIAVLDCPELRCETPNSEVVQSDEFSSYKSPCTFKGLVGMAPHGAITFVSRLYAGSMSEKEILRQSGIVSLLKPTMAIMVGKSFLVDDCVPCKIYRPVFLSKRAKMSAPEVRETQSITRLQVHLEQLIRRVKEHQLFDTVIPHSVTGSLNQLFTVACLLFNYQHGPLVRA